MAYQIKNTTIFKNPNIGIGIKFPIVGTNGNLFDISYTSEDQVVANLKTFFSTKVGERVMQPSLGIDLHQYLFEPDTATLRNNIQSEIEDAIEFWFPYISIKSLEITSASTITGAPNDNAINIKLVVMYNNKQVNQPLTFTVTGDGVQITT